MIFFPLALFAVSLVSASSCPASSASSSQCGDKPAVRLPFNSYQPDSPLLRFVVGGETSKPVDLDLASGQFKKCSRELERILFAPPNAAREYLLGIARELAADIMSLGIKLSDPQTVSLIRTLSARYDVVIELQPVFPDRPNIVFMPHMAPMPGPRKSGHLVTPTYLNQIGFEYNADVKAYSLALFAFSLQLATGVTIIVRADASSGVYFDC